MTQNNQQIPQGYKDSPLGVIPQEWEVRRLGEICRTFSGGTPKSTESSYYDGSIPFIKSGEINNNKTEQFLSEDGYKQSSAKMVVKGDILYALYGANSGECALCQINGAINQAILCIRTEINNYFLLSVLQRNKEFYIRNYLQGGQGNLSAEIVKSYLFAVPPLAEQRRIAEVLGCWDEAIERQGRMVSLLTTRKHALMQRLLSPKPHWQKTKLGELGEISSAGVDKKIVDGEIPVRLVNFLDVFRRDFIFAHELRHCVTANKDKVKKCQVKKGDVFFTPSSEMPTDIAISAVAMEDIDDAVYSYHIVRLRLKDNWDLRFRAYAFKTDYFYKQAEAICDGSGQRYVISQANFRQLEVFVPPIDEQKAIAEKLSTADTEIDLARRRLDLLRTQKRALMQQLLTGKKRLKI